GARVVYVSGALFVAPLDGSTPPVALSSTAAGVVAYDFALGARGTRVVYRGGPAADYAGLFSAALDGASAPLELVAPYARGDVQSSALSADERGVVFTSAHADGSLPRLYRVATDGGAPVELDPGHARVRDFQLTADGERVLFRSVGARENLLALYTVPL